MSNQSLLAYHDHVEAILMDNVEFLEELRIDDRTKARRRISLATHKQLDCLLTTLHAIYCGQIPLDENAFRTVALKRTLKLGQKQLHESYDEIGVPQTNKLDAWLQSPRDKKVDFLLSLTPLYRKVFRCLFEQPMTTPP